MPTTKQRKLAKELMDNALLDKPKGSTELLEKVGYATNTAEHKQKSIIEAQGVKDALAEYGLTEELITTALVSDIQNKEKNRLGELRLGAELLGKLDKKNEGNRTVIVVVSTESNSRYAPLESPE